jgi:hypothetical protein
MCGWELLAYACTPSGSTPARLQRPPGQACHHSQALQQLWAESYISLRVVASSWRYRHAGERHSRVVFACRAAGKPANIVERMVAGRLGKFYEEWCLLEQPFILDDSQKVRPPFSVGLYLGPPSGFLLPHGLLSPPALAAPWPAALSGS